MTETTTLTGTVLATSVPCQRLLAEDGARFWVSGLPLTARPGDRLVLDGAWRDLRSCNARAFVISRIIDGPGSDPGQNGD